MSQISWNLKWKLYESECVKTLVFESKIILLPSRSDNLNMLPLYASCDTVDEHDQFMMKVTHA